MEEFTYENAPLTGIPRVVDLTIWAKADSADNDEVEVDIYDGISWTNVGNITGLTVDYVKYTFDVSAILDTWVKINAAKSRVKYIEI